MSRRVSRDAAREREADRAADAVASGGHARGFSFSNISLNRAQPGPGHAPAGAAVVPEIVNQVLDTAGEPLDAGTRAFMEPRFGHDFSRVRIHTGTEAARSASALRADAFTAGDHVVFGAGRFTPGTQEGSHLLAHELAHTRQYGAGGLLISLKETDAAVRERAKKKLDAWAKAKTPSPSLDPDSADYAFTLQEYVHGTTHVDTDVAPKPTDAAELKKWRETFADAHQLALMIMDAPKAEQKESRAGMIAQDLAEAGFITEALDVAARFADVEQKRFVFSNVVARADAATAEQLGVISKHYADAGVDIADNPFATRLADKSGVYARSVGKTRLLAVLQPMLAAYKASDDFTEMVAQVLVFYKESRVPISEWLWTEDKDYLFVLLDSEWFVEPGYGGQAFTDASAMTMAGDMPWVYAYKQKYYVNWLVRLAARHKIDVKAPATLKFADIKTWLDANTGKIGSVLTAEYPAAPDEITKVYQHIADIFFFHVDRGDVTPDLGGKLTPLGPADPSAMRLKADCDVLATYAGRLLKSAGFDVIGYMALIPKDDVGHAVALVRQNKTFYIVNNKQVTASGATTKDEALKALRDDGLSIYSESPESFKVYYEDAGTDGSMTRDLWTTADSTRREDLEP